MYLLDTNVISETAKVRPHGAVMSWLEKTPSALMFLSTVTIAELQRGAERTRVHDPARAQRFDEWIDSLASGYNLLSLELEAAREWARLVPKRTDPNLEDAMIAAIARVHGLCVVTRNEKDFTRFGVALLNPFE